MTDSPDPRERDLQAGEYVLGLLSGPARRAFQARLEREPDLLARVRDWEDRLGPLAATLPPQEPPATLWPAIERALAAAAKPRRWRDSLVFWRTLAFASSAVATLALALALAMSWPADREAPPRPGMAVLVDAERRPVWLAETNPAGTRLELRPLAPPATPGGAAHELWLIAGPGEAPRSLGVIPPEGLSLAHLPTLLRPGATLAVSLEPTGGSPTGAPTGPVVQSGLVIDPRLKPLAVSPAPG